MSEDTTPNMTETLLETAIDFIPSLDSIMKDPDTEYKSKILREQYENGSQKEKDAMDFVVMAFTGKRLSVIMELNDSNNANNKNVG